MGLLKVFASLASVALCAQANIQLKINPQNKVYAPEDTLGSLRSETSDFIRSEIDNFMSQLNTHSSFIKADADVIRNAQYLTEGLRMTPMKVNVIERQNGNG